MNNYSYLFLTFWAIVLSLLAYLKLRRCNTPADFHPFDTNATLPVRGILAILVVCCHLGWRYLGDPISIFLQFGTPSVAVFFFISGYGLMASYQKKGKAYLTNFFRRRFSKLLPTFLLLLIVFGLYVYRSQLIPALIHDLCHGEPALPNSWFMYVIIYFYTAFYISCRLSRSKGQCICYMSLFMLLSMAVTMYAQWACFWYLSQPSFVAGMIVSAYEERLKKILCRYSFAVIFLILLIPILSLPNGSFFTARTFGLIIYTNFFPFGVLFMLYAYNPIRSKAIRYLGKISLEIYLVHGLVLFVVYKIGLLCGCSRLPWYAFVALTFILTIPIAAVAHQFNQKVASWFYDQQ